MFGPKTHNPQFTRMDSLRAKPIRAPVVVWSQDESRCVVASVPRRGDRFGRLVSSILIVPKEKTIHLDEVGSFVWNRMDGKTTVEEIVDALCEEFHIHRKEAESALAEFMRMLAKRGMIALAVSPGR